MASRNQIRLDIPDELADILAEAARQTGVSETKIAVGMLAMAAASFKNATLAQMCHAIGTNVPNEVAPVTAADVNVASTEVTPAPKPVRGPYTGAKPGDSDATLALIAELNAMPESSDISDPDLMVVNSMRRGELVKAIARNRASDAKKPEIEAVEAAKSSILNHLAAR